MSDVTHTPGPWYCSPSPSCDGEFIIKGSYENGGGPRLPILGRTHNFPNNAEANARLIAAAPDLLAALKPFAEIAAVFDPPNSGSRPDSGEVYVWSRMVNGKPKDFALTVEMLREARAAITRASRAGGE